MNRYLEKLIIQNAKNCKKESFLSMFFIALETLMDIIIPLMMARLIDNGILLFDFEVIKKYSVYILILVVFQISFGSLSAFFAAKAATTFSYDLRKSVFEKIQEFSFKNIDRFSTGSLVTRTTTDIINIKQAFQSIIRGAIRAIFMIVFSLVVSFTINSKISLLMLLSVPFIFISFYFISKKSMPIFDKVFQGFDNLNNVLSENIRGIRVVKSFNREEFENKKFKNVSDDIYKNYVKAETYAALWSPIMNIAMYFMSICIAYFGTIAIVNSNNNPVLGLTTGNLMSLITYSVQLLMSLMMLAFLVVMIMISMTSFKRIFEVINEKSDITNVENPIFEMKKFDIEFKNVNFKYKNKAKKFVLENINLKINEGESIGIIGGTGSGKSSLVQLIPRFYDIVDGSLTIGNVDIKQYDINTLRKNIGMVLQKNVLFSGTIRSNLTIGNLNATDDKINFALDVAHATEFVNEKPGRLDYKVEQGGTNFSGGQKQRLCIARALVKNPKILIFDDSTASVDTKTDRSIKDALKNNFKNSTKIIIAQKILSIIDCDKILVLDNGKIVGFGTNESLLENCKIYKEIYDLQMRGSDE